MEINTNKKSAFEENLCPNNKYMHTANRILFWCGLSVLIVAAAPILLFITAIVLRDLLIAILMFFMLVCTELIHPWLGAILGEIIEELWLGTVVKDCFSIISVCYPSVFFLATLGISVAVFAVAGVFWAYKKIKYNNLVKNLKPPVKTYPYQKLLDINLEKQSDSFGYQGKDDKNKDAPDLTAINNLQK